MFRQPDLARTLRAMMDAEKKALAAGKSRAAAIEAVRDYFYRGPIAREIAAYVEANGGPSLSATRISPVSDWKSKSR